MSATAMSFALQGAGLKSSQQIKAERDAKLGQYLVSGGRFYKRTNGKLKRISYDAWRDLLSSL